MRGPGHPGRATLAKERATWKPHPRPGRLTLLLMNLLFTWLLDRFPWLEKHLVGEPAVLLSDGRAQWERMRREGVTRDELMAALREHGVTDLDEVRLAVLEV